MAAPTTTVRTTPLAPMQTDGHPTKIAFALDPDVQFWEKETTPPGEDGGEKIDITTFFNTAKRTYAPRVLMEGTDIEVTAAYNPRVITNILNLINQPGSVTCIHPAGFGTTDFYGYLKSWKPQKNVEGTQPTCDIVIVQTNYDPVNFTEENPVYKTAGGTVIAPGL